MRKNTPRQKNSKINFLETELNPIPSLCPQTHPFNTQNLKTTTHLWVQPSSENPGYAYDWCKHTRQTVNNEKKTKYCLKIWKPWGVLVPVLFWLPTSCNLLCLTSSHRIFFDNVADVTPCKHSSTILALFTTAMTFLGQSPPNYEYTWPSEPSHSQFHTLRWAPFLNTVR